VNDDDVAQGPNRTPTKSRAIRGGAIGTVDFDTSSAPKCPCLCSQPATKRKPPHAESKAKHLPPKYSVLFSCDHLRFEGAAETESVVSDPDPETIILIRGC